MAVPSWSPCLWEMLSASVTLGSSWGQGGWGPLTATKNVSTRPEEGQGRAHQLMPFLIQGLGGARRGTKNKPIG